MNEVEQYWHKVERRIERRTGWYMPNIYWGIMTVCAYFLFAIGQEMCVRKYGYRTNETKKEERILPNTEKTLENRIETINTEEIKH